MATANDYQQIRDGLRKLLEPHLPGIEVEVGRSRRWQRMTVTFRHEKFASLLPEQRFRALLQLIPSEFYETYLRDAVWFELAPGENAETVSQARRSEDVAAEEPGLARVLLQSGFFQCLAGRLAQSPIEKCCGDFAVTRAALADAGLPDPQQRDACLVFIRHGAYCDCEVLLAARGKLEELYGKE